MATRLLFIESRATHGWRTEDETPMNISTIVPPTPSLTSQCPQCPRCQSAMEKNVWAAKEPSRLAASIRRMLELPVWRCVPCGIDRPRFV